jgi:hypothetical protein
VKSLPICHRSDWDGSSNWQKKWSREIAAELGIPSFFMKSRCELKEDEEEEEEEVDQVTYNSNSTACASSDSDSSIHQGTQDSKQLPVGPISYSIWWNFLLHFPYHTSYNYSFQVQMWNVCSCMTKDSEFLQVLADVFEVWWIGCLSMQEQSKTHLGSIKLIQS